MKNNVIVICLLLFCNSFIHSQVDFSIFLSKKGMKNNYSKLFHNFREYGKLECVQGDCKNGFSILKVTNGNQMKLIIVGNFRDKTLNGEAVFFSYGDRHYFNDNANKVISSAIKYKTNLKQLFQEYKADFFESYFGTFQNTILVNNGAYYLNAKIKEIVSNPKSVYDTQHRLHKIPLTHFEFINQTKQDRSIIYEYNGGFKTENDGKPRFSLSSGQETLTIRTPEFPEIVLRASEKQEIKYIASYYSGNGDLIKEEVLTSENITKAIANNKEDAKKLKEQRRIQALNEKQEELNRIKASSPCNAVGKWVYPGDLPDYSGGSVCTKSGKLVAFYWQHPLMANVSYVISHYNDHFNGRNGRSVYFPEYYVDKPGTYTIYAKKEDLAVKDDKVFVTTYFDTSVYNICNSCHGTGQLHITDNNPNILQATHGWFLAYNHTTSWKRNSTSTLQIAESRETYIDRINNNGKLGLSWQEGLKEGINIMPCVICDGMGCLPKQ